MIRNIEIAGFQGTQSARVKLAPVTFFTGLNGSGKTSLAEAIPFAFLGESMRGGVTADVIRRGEDAAEVEITLADAERTTIKRRQTPSGASRWIDGEKVLDKAFDKAVREKVGDPRYIRAAFDARNLFAEKFDLQKFLLDLTGGKLEGETLAAAFGEATRAAAERLGLVLPRTLAEFGGEKTGREGEARTRRAAAKRVVEEREADLARLPAPTVDVGERTVAELETALRATRAELAAAERAKAASGADAQARREERIATLRATIAKLEADVAEARAGLSGVAGRESRAIEKELTAKRNEAAQKEAHVAALQEQIEDTTKDAAGGTAADEALALTAPERARAYEEQRKVFANVRNEVARLETEAAALMKEIEKIPDEPPCTNACKHCPVANKQAIERELRAQLDALNARIVKAKAEKDAAEEKGKKLADEHDAADAAVVRVEARQELSLARERLAQVDAEAKGARIAETALTEELDTARKVAAARLFVDEKARELDARAKELAQVEATPLPEAPAADIGALRERVVREEQLVEAARARDARARALAAVEKAKAEVQDADLVAKALGKDGVRAELIAQAVRPFTDAANDALRLFAPGWSVEVSPDPFGIVLAQDGAVFRPEQLSDGHRTRLLYVLQYAIAQLSGVRLVVFDRAELLDGAGWKGLDELVLACAEGQIQVLVLLHGKAPPVDGEMAAAYVVEAGVVRKAGAPTPVPATSVEAAAGVA
jgi:DNA repair exonuclease SbcCD ATPase subunit